jgi:hypothetical protein
MQVLRWGGRAFLVIGIVTIPVETALAPEGQRARTFVGASGGLAGGLALGAAGAKVGLLCGPWALVCSPVLAIGGGVAGALGARRLAEAIYDAFTGSSTDFAEPKYCGPCPSCHCVGRPKSLFERFPEMAPPAGQLLPAGVPAPGVHRMSPTEVEALTRWLAEPATK